MEVFSGRLGEIKEFKLSRKHKKLGYLRLWCLDERRVTGIYTEKGDDRSGRLQLGELEVGSGVQLLLTNLCWIKELEVGGIGDMSYHLCSVFNLTIASPIHFVSDRLIDNFRISFDDSEF